MQGAIPRICINRNEQCAPDTCCVIKVDQPWTRAASKPFDCGVSLWKFCIEQGAVFVPSRKGYYGTILYSALPINFLLVKLNHHLLGLVSSSAYTRASNRAASSCRTWDMYCLSCSASSLSLGGSYIYHGRMLVAIRVRVTTPRNELRQKS